MFLGIDCGTQGTKALLWDADRQDVLATSYQSHTIISGRSGQKEQHPRDWLSAMQSCVQEVIACSGIFPSLVKGIGVSGQQHGLVILDHHDDVIRPAKLWCDTECETELQAFLQEYQSLHGESLTSVIGIQVPVAFTLGKLLWVRQHEPEKFSRINKIMLPHEYLNYVLTGEFRAEPGDASGTGYFDTRNRSWCISVVELLGPDFILKLPELIGSREPHGFLSARSAEFLGLPSGIVVSSGGGDNMMSAIGTGNISPGRLTMSLGTSGTLATCQPAQVDCTGFEDINTFCSSSGDWLPLIGTMNVTNAINSYRQLMDIDIQDFDNYLMASKPGAEGLFSFPWLFGARLPNLPGARGEISGITMANFTKPHLLRSVVEGSTFNLCKGIDIFNARGMMFDCVSVIGGGANSPVWCQMIADITGITVKRPAIYDAAALGAAIQAHWCHNSVSGSGVSATISSVMPAFLIEQCGELVRPDLDVSKQYRQIYQAYHAEVDVLKARYLN